ncbi:MAG: N-acetyltransferase [Acidobacteria bacterium]|nr:N-acetyltransferase [Acidobacteriota bacterium]MBI3656843.1 N-acetyltransferase [Acidobacteriota bacterium]
MASRSDLAKRKKTKVGLENRSGAKAKRKKMPARKPRLQRPAVKISKTVKFLGVRFVGRSITVGKGVRIGEHSVIYDHVVLGDDVVLGRNVRINPNVIIGRGSVIEDNAIIGYQTLTRIWKAGDGMDRTELGEEVLIRPNTVIYTGCKIGSRTKISHNVVIREMTTIGENTSVGCLSKCEGYTTIGSFCSIHALTMISSFMTIEDYVFIGPCCTTINDYRIDYRREFSYAAKGPTIKFGARIGSNATIMPGVVIGREALIGAGSLVTKDVPELKVAYGVPARLVADVKEEERVAFPKQVIAEKL